MQEKENLLKPSFSQHKGTIQSGRQQNLFLGFWSSLVHFTQPMSALVHPQNQAII